METSAAPAIAIASSAGLEPRLLNDQAALAREDLAAYRQLGGYQPLGSADDLLGEVESGGLLGRGGAGFPLAVKVRAVRDNGPAAGGTVVIANGEEGEPASIKDRWLLRHRPHLILDGLRLAAAMVAADRAYVYVSDPDSARSVETALAELEPDALGGIVVEVPRVDPGYIAGEETAAIRAINGGPVKPTDKPPRPFQSGVGGRPTLVIPGAQDPGAETGDGQDGFADGFHADNVSGCRGLVSGSGAIGLAGPGAQTFRLAPAVL